MNQESIDKLTPKEVRDYSAASKRFIQEVRNDPQKAKAFLIRAGICVKNDASPSGIELAPRFRSRQKVDGTELDSAEK